MGLFPFCYTNLINNMSKRRYINTKFWSDTYIDDLNKDEKLLFLYLLTNERTNVAGVYELPVKYMSIETGIDIKEVHKTLKKFEKDGKFKFFEGWVITCNFLKHQNLGNTKIVIGIQRILKDVPSEVMTHARLIHDTSHSDSDLDLYSDLYRDYKTPVKYKFEKIDMKLAKLLEKKVKENFPSNAKVNLDSWANDIRMLREVDEFNEQQIEFMIYWVHGGTYQRKKIDEHSFWSANIRSAFKLRKQRHTLMAQIQRQYKLDTGVLKSQTFKREITQTL